ncbi:MAG: retroviral-like aspartic protease family protein, partial [Candidatus Eremiobacteraeota bacterium]|nr:retroviral-like aspartic protease family protein [Candidatus Eremiobacteraeota bacterium]
PNLQSALASYATGLARLGVHDPSSLETTGAITGNKLSGGFHMWHADRNDRFDQTLGPRTERTFRKGDREFIVNASGNVRELIGSLVARQTTQDFIASGDFAKQPQYDALLGPATLPDGRAVVQVRVAPPKGDVETVSLDAKSGLVDMVSYVEGDGISTITYSDFRVLHGALVPFVETDSNGDTAFDIALRVEHVIVDRTIAPVVFAVPTTSMVSNDAPVTVKLTVNNGHVYAPVVLRGHTYNFLVDTGAQAVFVDSTVAAANVLIPEGTLEISGAKRVRALGVASLESIDIGGATLPVGLVSVIDMGNSTQGAFPIDGVLGYPFFASSEVRIDFARLTMTFGKPGSLPPVGDRIDIDTDRQLPECPARINGTSSNILIDTGNSVELLIFNPFFKAHPGLITYLGGGQVSNYGVGGSMAAVGANVDQLDIGPYRMFNRRTNLMLSSSGAFADRVDGGNVGLGTLKNFVVTFDMANREMYLARGKNFDDGRDRPLYDNPDKQ